MDVVPVRRLPRPKPKAGTPREFVRSFGTREEALNPPPLKKGVFGNKGGDTESDSSEDELPPKPEEVKPEAKTAPPPDPVIELVPPPRATAQPVTEVPKPVAQVPDAPRAVPPAAGTTAMGMALQATLSAHGAVLMRIEHVFFFVRYKIACDGPVTETLLCF
jgi:hypothetical protein